MPASIVRFNRIFNVLWLDQDGAGNSVTVQRVVLGDVAFSSDPNAYVCPGEIRGVYLPVATKETPAFVAQGVDVKYSERERKWFELDGREVILRGDRPRRERATLRRR
ncbi:MAG: hypothetical protein QM811_16635 [Pirellulales bacterium]